ncbi:MAG: hypothetical protein K2H14_10645, partial [Muribaculaceae bacterium]|nr:hypothetical protein [Muribaculaceae bacterium]
MMALGVRVDLSKTMKLTLPSGNVRNVSVSPVKEETYAYQGTTQVYDDAPGVSADGFYSVNFDATGAVAGGLDFLTVAYPRVNALGDDAQEMWAFKSLSPSWKIAVDGASESTRIWMFSDGEGVREMECGVTNGTEGDGARRYVMSPGRYDVASEGECCYLVAFDPDRELKSVEYDGVVANQNLHGLEAPHMLIISSPLLLSEAERLAEAHRMADGIDVAVVNVDEAYNEFSSGTPHLMALRRLARMLADREPGKLRSVLLMGAASYDNRGLTAADQKEFRRNLIPMYMREDIVGSGKLPESYASDAVAGMLNEDEGAFDIGRGIMTVNVGRIPAHTVAEAHAAVTKAVRHMTMPVFPDMMNRALLMCDKGNNNGHMDDADSLARRINAVSPYTTIYKAYNTVYPIIGKTAAELHKCAEWVLKRGASYMSYSGHATPRDLGANMIWGTQKVAEIEYDYPPFVMLATCRALYYDHHESNLGETMLYRDNGGAIVLVGALREVYKEYNQQFSEALGSEFFSAGAGMSYGDVFRRARNRMVPATPPTGASYYYDLIYNTLSYNMVGDPELKVPVATHCAEIVGVGGKAVGGEEGFAIQAERPVALNGRVTGPDGSVDLSFDGEVTVSVFDGPHTQPTINHDSSSSKQDVEFDETLLYEGKAVVKGGEFVLNAYVPRPNFGDRPSRVVMWAVSADGRSARGGCGDVAIDVDDSPAEPSESMTPVITAMYVGGEDFRDGDVVGGDVTIHAEVAANEAGIVGSTSVAGRGLKVVVDGGRVLSDAEHCFVSGTDGGGVLDMRLDGLADGHHVVDFKVFNNAGQSASRSVSFTVVNSVLNARLTVGEMPAASEAVIMVEHDGAVAPEGRLVVRDGAGRVVFTDAQASFPYRWELKDSDGADVADGRYTVEAFVRSGSAFGHAAEAEVVVVR